MRALREDTSLRALGLVVEEVIGEGGSAIVYRARDARHDRDVAIKIIRDVPALENAVARFAQEIRVAGALRHAHILPLFDSGTLQDGRLFSVMPVAQGRPLSAMIDEGPLTVDDAVRLAREVAEALAHLHRSGYVHRDIKPENILVESGHAVLTDFGIAVPMGKRLTYASPTAAEHWLKTVPERGRFTQAGGTVGTVAYMSPESILSDGPVDGLTDIYALGIVLYEMLAGELPFKSTRPEQLLALRMRNGLPSIRTIRPDVPRPLDTIIARATSPDASRRFATADEMAAALGAVRSSQATPRRLGSLRDPRPLSIGLVVVLAASIAGAVLLYRARHASALDPQRVAVADLANDTGDSAQAGIGALAGDVIVAALTVHTRLTVVNAAVALPSRHQRLLPVADSTLAQMTRSLVSSTRAGLLVTGAYFRVGTGLEVVAELTDTRSGRIIGTAGPIHAVANHLDASLRVLGDSVVAILLRRHVPPG